MSEVVELNNPVSASEELVIESGVPLPPPATVPVNHALRDFIAKMKEGDSVFIQDEKKATNFQNNLIKVHGPRTCQRRKAKNAQGEQGFRIWRVEPTPAVPRAPRKPKAVVAEG